MSTFTLLADLATELHSNDEWERLVPIASSSPLDVEALRQCDDSLPGPSLSRIADNPNAPGTLGIPRWGITRCEVADREIFRPLHYSMVDFFLGEIEELEWRTRSIVEHSGAHLERLLRRIGRTNLLPFGDVLLRLLRPEIDHVTWDQLQRFKMLNNSAKHRYDHPLGTHFFSVEEAVLAYLVARRRGWQLYPLARLATDWRFHEEMAFGH